MKGRTRFVTPLAWTAFLIVALAVLNSLNTGTLALPDDNWSAWLRESDPTIVAFALTRVLALVVVWYLIVTTALAFAAAVLGRARLLRLTDAVSLPFVRRLGRQVAGLTVVGTLAMPGATYAAEGLGPVDDVPILRHVGPSTVTTTSPPPSTTAPIAASPPNSTVEVSAPYASAPVIDSPSAEPPKAIEPDATYIISAGENFWVVADRVLAERLGRAPSADEVTDYWRQLVSENRATLADRSNPDLVFPGQVLKLP